MVAFACHNQGLGCLSSNISESNNFRGFLRLPPSMKIRMCTVRWAYYICFGGRSPLTYERHLRCPHRSFVFISNMHVKTASHVLPNTCTYFSSSSTTGHKSKRIQNVWYSFFSEDSFHNLESRCFSDYLKGLSMCFSNHQLIKQFVQFWSFLWKSKHVPTYIPDRMRGETTACGGIKS